LADNFVFELQNILDFRNFEKEQAEIALAKALADEGQIKNNLESIAAQFLQLKKMTDSMTSFEEIAASSQHKSLLEYQKEELLKQLAQAELVTQEKRKALAEVMKKTNALEKLKESDEAAYKEEEAKKESDFIDDLSNASSGRRNHR